MTTTNRLSRRAPRNRLPRGMAVMLAASVLAFAASPALASVQRCQANSEHGRHAPAIEYCTSAIDNTAGRPTIQSLAYFFRANSYYSTGRMDEALADVQAALDRDPGNGRTIALRGSIRLATGDVTGAINDLTSALRAGFVDLRVRRQRADAFLLLGVPARAVVDLSTIVAADPRDAVALTQLALAQNAAGDPSAARQTADRAIRANSDYTLAYGVRAMIESEAGEVDAALADFALASNAAPNTPAYRAGRASLLLRVGRIDEALAEADAALGAQPDLISTRALRADIREAQGDFAGALDDLDLVPATDADGLLRRARLALRLKQLMRAERTYTLAIGTRANDAAAFFERGQVRARLGQHAVAETDLSQALALNAGFADDGLRLMRGTSRFKAGNVAGAAKDFAAEAARTPNAARPLIWQVRSLSDLGDYQAAETAARRLIELEPNTARAHAILGDVLLKAGDFVGGRDRHKRALAIDPNFVVSRERLELLDQVN